jgi:hypothetical protein
MEESLSRYQVLVILLDVTQHRQSGKFEITAGIVLAHILYGLVQRFAHGIYPWEIRCDGLHDVDGISDVHILVTLETGL